MKLRIALPFLMTGAVACVVFWVFHLARLSCQVAP